MRYNTKSIFAVLLLVFVCVPIFTFSQENTKYNDTSLLACSDEVFSLSNKRFMHKLKAKDSKATLRVKGLPIGLNFNQERCLVEGVAPQSGDYVYIVEIVSNNQVDRQNITLHVRDSLPMATPFMGWLSWNLFEYHITAQAVKDIALAFKENGLMDAGYKYLVIDDYWHAAARDSLTHKPLYDTVKFPLGLKELTDFVHTQGLKIGIYSDAGEKTCAGMYGSNGYEFIDAKQYADWGFDLLKYDYCFAPEDVDTAILRYTLMGEALKQCGRDIVYYMCEWGVRQPWLWGSKTGASCWRTTYDTRDCWQGKWGGIGVVQTIEEMKNLAYYSGVNRFNDADMMCIGLWGKGKSSSDLCATGPGMTIEEYKTQFSLWCMWSSPLTLSNDPSNMSQEDISLVTNPELISINQDQMGQAAVLIYERKGIQVYIKDLSDGSLALAVLNLNDTEKKVNLNLSKLLSFRKQETFWLHDCWLHTDLEPVKKNLALTLQAHQTQVFKLNSNR